MVGGPQGDCGVTGRKIIVDTYAAWAVTAAARFPARIPPRWIVARGLHGPYVAKNIVAAKLARRCEVQLAYAIGYHEPVSVLVHTFGTAIVPDEKIEWAIRKVFGLRPAQIVQQLDLLRPIYEETAQFGHFGRNDRLDIFTWERTDKIDALLKLF